MTYLKQLEVEEIYSDLDRAIYKQVKLSIYNKINNEVFGSINRQLQLSIIVFQIGFGILEHDGKSN